jgi:hypothetical protein
MGEPVSSALSAGRESTSSSRVGRVREPLLSSRGAAQAAADADAALDRFFAALRATYVDLGTDAAAGT